MGLNNIRFNVIVYAKEETNENYNRVYQNYPRFESIEKCLRIFLKRRNTNRYDGIDIFKLAYDQKNHCKLKQKQTIRLK